jgi:hypothetical protein
MTGRGYQTASSFKGVGGKLAHSRSTQAITKVKACTLDQGNRFFDDNKRLFAKYGALKAPEKRNAEVIAAPQEKALHTEGVQAKAAPIVVVVTKQEAATSANQSFVE